MKVVEDIGSADPIVEEDKFKKVYETRVIAVLCFALYELNRVPWFLQLRADEVTDAFIARQSPKNPGDAELLGVEVTSYFRRRKYSPNETLIEQLKKTKMFADWHKYTDHDIVLVDLGTGYRPDFEEIREYMASIKAPYQLWFIQEVDLEHPDTILQMTRCDSSGVLVNKLDIGEAWNDMKKKGIRGSIRMQRTGDKKKIGIYKGDPIKGAPWETMV